MSAYDHQEPERKNHSVLDLASKFKNFSAVDRWQHGHPRGALVHYSATPPGFHVENLILDMTKKHLRYCIIDEQGGIHMPEDLNYWGYHAGPSYWTGLGKNISNNLIGIEVMCPGRSLEEKDHFSFYPWWSPARPIKHEKLRIFEEDVGNIRKGVYWPFNEDQEGSLSALLFALKERQPNTFDFNLVLGHDEVRGPANGKHTVWEKTDPGGCLSMPMAEYREMLKSLYKAKES